MPMVVRPPGLHQTAVMRSGDAPTIGTHSPLEDLLPSSGALAPAPAPAPHRALALDAIQLRRGLRDAHRRPERWADSSFAREVELVRRHLAPLRNRRSLTASFGREAFQTLGVTQARPTPMGPIRAAYAIRWLELGGRASLPIWPRLIESAFD
jgi:hypothetical protein